MPIVYYVDYACPVKESVKPGRMLRLLYARERAHEALHKARREKPDAKAEDVQVSLSLKGESGGKHLRNMPVAEVLKQFAILERFSEHCTDCRARVEHYPFGCRARVDFPISFKAEAFLMGLIHARDGDPTPTLLCNYLENNGMVGTRPSEMRKLAGMFFESEKPLVRRFADGRRLSINQLFELLFLTERISTRHARFLLGLLGIYTDQIPLGPPLEHLPNLFIVEKEDAGLKIGRAGLTLTESPEADRSTRQVQNFFGGLLLGSELGCDVWVKA